MRTSVKGTNKKGRSKAKKAFIIALGVSLLGGGAYLGWDYFRNRRNLGSQLPEDDQPPVPNSFPVNQPTNLLPAKAANESFPLKRGSLGNRVVQLQQALDSILGAGTMKRSYGGIDGVFGPGTASALKKAGFPEVIDEETFNKIIFKAGGPKPQFSQFDAKELATQLYRAAQAKNTYTVLSILKLIKTIPEYTQVNEYYKNIPIISKTIVTDLLDYAFKADEPARQMFKTEFLRIGLKVDSSGTWSLQGVGLYKDLITIKDTVVTDMSSNKIVAPKGTILGDELRTADGMTWFRSVDNTILKVPTRDVKYMT